MSTEIRPDFMQTRVSTTKDQLRLPVPGVDYVADAQSIVSVIRWNVILMKSYVIIWSEVFQNPFKLCSFCHAAFLRIFSIIIYFSIIKSGLHLVSRMVLIKAGDI